MSHGLGEPSSWITRWAPAVPADATVLDLACGGGRHLRWWAARGHRVTGVDRDTAALAPLADLGEMIAADIEDGPWPLNGRQFDLVLVTHYLWRPLWPQILASVAPGGLLLYETFAHGHEALGRPSRPDFLLKPGELLEVCAGWQVLGYEAGQLAQPPRIVQRIAVRRPVPSQPPVHLRLP
jgi:SAM-dependent methyltransferase